MSLITLKSIYLVYSTKATNNKFLHKQLKLVASF